MRGEIPDTFVCPEHESGAKKNEQWPVTARYIKRVANVFAPLFGRQEPA